MTFMKIMMGLLIGLAEEFSLIIMDWIARILVHVVIVSFQIYFDLPVTPIDYI